jgi:hypothetical protein
MTDIATNLNTIDGSLSDIKTAIVNKGGTVSGNITTFATAIDNIPSGGGSGTTDVPLTRISDDNGNEIGTWYMNFKDDNNNTYKIVLLDAQYRSVPTDLCSDSSADVTNMPVYTDLVLSNIWEAGETATQNTQLILDYCNANNYTSTACSHCRSKSFVIGGVTYYGQLPNALEVSYIAKNYNSFDAMDTSSSSSPTTNFSSSQKLWTSTQGNSQRFFVLVAAGTITMTGRKSSQYQSIVACPVLEIPLS